MAIRGPGKTIPSLQPGGGKGPSPAEASLIKAGLAKTPQEARSLMRTFVQRMGGAKGTTLEEKFNNALKGFQEKSGLPTSGKLDGQTSAALKKDGLLGSKKAAPTEPKTTAKPDSTSSLKAPAKGKWGGFAGKPILGDAPKASGPAEKRGLLEVNETAQKAELSRPKTDEQLQKLSASLGSFGFFGGGKGAAQFRGALKKFQAEHDLPQNGKLDSETLSALHQEGVLGEGKESSGSTRGNQQGATDSRGMTSSRQTAESPTYENIYAKGDPSQQAAKENAEAEGKRALKKDKKKRKNAHGGDGEGDGFDSEGEGAPEDADLPGEESDSANAASGDENYEDRRRGHAQDGDVEADRGYYEVPSLAEQMEDALARIQPNDDDRGALTYSWDVTFFVPGVYGAGQQAEPLWHIVVDKSGPFDPVWHKARATLNERLQGRDPTCPALSDERFTRALRKARSQTDR
ncbi:MAG: hypothetical protein GY822_08360 [Deltaproteobacteria bacterium]|nr:hypothetical protein [Deltaproteobacteria bacterium]